MSIAGVEVFAIIGFLFAAYAVVGNDALQTLGTFINSNRRLHWTVLFGFAALILVVTFTHGWFVNDGDPSYGRLSNTSKYPVIDVQWYHILPPLVLLIITRMGIPVSTSFMVLTIFASIGGLGSMIEKSLIGYGLAFLVGFGVYLLVSKTLEKRFEETPIGTNVPRGMITLVGASFLVISNFLINLNEAADGVGAVDVLMQTLQSPMLLALIGLVVAAEFLAIWQATQDRVRYWVAAQWLTTGYLWAVWLIQDFANIFVFLPRELTALQGFAAMFAIFILLGYTFWNQGGPVQRILKSKQNVTDIRSATIIDFLYASLLFFFKELNDLPMSTTWVFLGLIAGREYAFALMRKIVTVGATVLDTFDDLGKAFLGLVISIDLAVGLPLLARMATGENVDFAAVFPNNFFLGFVIIANLMLTVVIWYLMRKDKPATAGFFMVMAAGATVFFMTVDRLNDKPSTKTPAIEKEATLNSDQMTYQALLR